MADKLSYNSTYNFLKNSCCLVGVCKHDGNCDGCEHALLREYAARDTDRIASQMRLLEAATLVIERMKEIPGVSNLDEALNDRLNAFDRQVEYENLLNHHWTKEKSA